MNSNSEADKHADVGTGEGVDADGDSGSDGYGEALASSTDSGGVRKDGIVGGGDEEDEEVFPVPNRNPCWEDPEALEYWVRAWATGGTPGPSGDTLHR